MPDFLSEFLYAVVASLTGSVVFALLNRFAIARRMALVVVIVPVPAVMVAAGFSMTVSSASSSLRQSDTGLGMMCIGLGAAAFATALLARRSHWAVLFVAVPALVAVNPIAVTNGTGLWLGDVGVATVGAAGFFLWMSARYDNSGVQGKAVLGCGLFLMGLGLVALDQWVVTFGWGVVRSSVFAVLSGGGIAVLAVGTAMLGAGLMSERTSVAAMAVVMFALGMVMWGLAWVVGGATWLAGCALVLLGLWLLHKRADLIGPPVPETSADSSEHSAPQTIGAARRSSEIAHRSVRNTS